MIIPIWFWILGILVTAFVIAVIANNWFGLLIGAAIAAFVLWMISAFAPATPPPATPTPVAAQPGAPVKADTPAPAPAPGQKPAPGTSQPIATGPCVARTTVMAILNKWHDANRNDPRPAIAELEKLANLQKGQTISRGPSGNVVFWGPFRENEIDQKDARGEVVPLFAGNGQWIYGSWDTDVTTASGGSGIALCQRLDPEVDLNWWAIRR